MLGLDVLRAKFDGSTGKQLGDQTIELARDMQFPNPELILDKSANPSMAAKVMLAYYRLIYERVLDYERDERIRIPTLPY